MCVIGHRCRKYAIFELSLKVYYPYKMMILAETYFQLVFSLLMLKPPDYNM